MPKGIGIQLIDNNDGGVVCDVKIDVQRDSSGKITSGFVIGNTVKQDQALHLIANQGDLKNKPFLGIGFGDALLDDDLLEYRHRIREQFPKVGLKINTLDLYTTSKIIIDAAYGDNNG